MARTGDLLDLRTQSMAKKKQKKTRVHDMDCQTLRRIVSKQNRKYSSKVTANLNIHL